MKRTPFHVPFVLLTLATLAGLSAEENFEVYAPSRTSNSLIHVSAQGEGSSLSLSLTRKIDLGFSPATIVAHPRKPLLYVSTNRTLEDTSPGAVIFLDGEGAYERHQALALHHGYSYLSLDRANRYLLGCNYGDGHIDVYPLDESGVPGARVAALNEGRRNAHCVLPSPDNRFVYIPYVKDTNALYQYRFDPDSGGLTALDPRNANPPEGTGPRHLAYHPRLPFLYFSNEQHLGVSVYEQNPTGQLQLRQVCDAVDEDRPREGLSSSDIVITPDGRYLFAGIRGHKQNFDRISRYRVLDDGTVQLLGRTPADSIPWGLALSPNSQYLLVTAFRGATLTAFHVGDDGSLAKAASLDWDANISDVVTR